MGRSVGTGTRRTDSHGADVQGAGTHHRKVLFGRRRGRRLRPSRQRLIDDALPRLRVTLPAPGARLDVDALFPGPVREVWLEVGFGGGEHLAAQAVAHPEIGFIGCEPFVNGVANLLVLAEDQNLTNLRLHPDDARSLIAALPDATIGRVFVLFPDPWPKKRQHKRRFIGTENLDALARVMCVGGELRLATDHADYLEWMLAHLAAHPAFARCAEGAADSGGRPADWPATRYEHKALAAGVRCAYLRYRRRPRGDATPHGS